MQGQWAGGKGSKERISDYKTYTSNYDKIFNKEKEMTAVMNWDVYSDPYERGGVDLLEGDTIQYQKVSGGFEITLLEEFPGCVGAASGRSNQPFVIAPGLFDQEYKPALCK